jgi:hypothetical protein
MYLRPLRLDPVLLHDRYRFSWAETLCPTQPEGWLPIGYMALCRLQLLAFHRANLKS